MHVSKNSMWRILYKFFLEQNTPLPVQYRPQVEKKKSQNNSESDNDTYCSDGDTTVDVGGAIQRIETNAVPEQVGNPCMSQSGKATTVWSRVCNYKSEQLLTSHGVPGRRIWPPRSLQTQERTARNKPKVSAQAFVPPGTCECLSSELKRWWFFLMGKTWERVRMCRECITVRPLLTSALTKTSLDSTSSFFCSSPCSRALECQWGLRKVKQTDKKYITWIRYANKTEGQTIL